MCEGRHIISAIAIKYLIASLVVSTCSTMLIADGELLHMNRLYC